jgi:LacI family transcriptional regulator
VIALNDRLAMGVYQAVTASGRRVPEDLSVISFDNSDIARWLEPGLSSLDLPYFDLGRRRMRLRARASVAPPRPRTPTAPRPVRLPAADRPS